MEIKNFEDFLKFHKDSHRPIYMVRGKLEPGYDFNIQDNLCHIVGTYWG